MTRPNITPGPWTATNCGSHLQVHREGWPRDAWNIADFGFQAQDEANARAIAAVPALLEALETLLLRSQKHLPQNADHDGLTNCDAIAKARAALTAAGYQF